MRKLYIIGAGGLGKEIATLIMDINRELPAWELAGFFDDNSSLKEVAGVPVIGTVSGISDYAPCAVILAIGNPIVKESIARQLPDNIRFPSLIHPSATIQNPTAIQIGDGAVICAGVRLTTDITIGKHVLLNLNTTVGHDSRIGDFTSVMPGVNIAGGIKIQNKVLVGSGANLIHASTLGEGCRVGAGAVVTKDVEPGDTVVGIPAKKVNE